MINFRLTLVGRRPLIMHSSRLANPLDPLVKESKKITAKRTNKTDEDLLELARLEHNGSLYMDAHVGPFLPGENIERSLMDAARMTRQGKTIERGVYITTDVNPLAYRGPRDAQGLWADENFRLMSSVKVQRARLMRCRPIFREWSTEVEGTLDPNILNWEVFEEICHSAGAFIGIGDWRPRYGRFSAELEQVA